MKVVILAGGLGTRLAEETVLRPKPMVEIGGKPILWHIMQIYGAAGCNEFIIALGYKGEVVKEYFLNFFALNNDLTVDLCDGKTIVHGGVTPNWKVHLVDTGQTTQTGGRLRRLRKWIGDEPFFATYGDGVANVDVRETLKFHKAHGKLATMTAVHPPSRFGAMELEDSFVTHFQEKPQAGEGWINGGFFVFDPQVLDFIDGDDTALELAPMKRLADERQLMAHAHEGFWQPMDTLRERHLLETLWQTGAAPWKIW
jgi:glucose-1-phosphate cytidylyltransferase